MRRALETLALSVMALSCRAGDAPPPMSTPVAERSAYIPAATASDAGAVETDDTLGRPTATDSVITYALPWVVLGQNVVDTRNGQRTRIVPFGHVRIASDQAHFALFDGRGILFGAITDPNGDYRAPALLEDLSTFTFSDDGAIGLWIDQKGTVVLADARAKSRAVLARSTADTGESEAEARPSLRNLVDPDGRRITWLDGERARFRDLATGQTRDLRARGKLAALTQIAGDTWVASFGDELVVQRISTGGEVVRKQKTGTFILSDDGKTVAWEDASAKTQTLVLYDVDHARETGRVAVQDDPDSKAPAKFAGACGGGTFSLLADASTLRGTSVTLYRDCSLVDEVTVDLATGKVGPITSVTPGSDDIRTALVELLCTRVQVKCEDQSDVVWRLGDNHAVLRDKRGKLAVFDARTGRRLAPLVDADTTKTTDLVLAPDGKTLAAINDAGEAHLWDAATGKVRWKGNAQP